MSHPLDNLSQSVRQRLKRKKTPAWTTPMLATLTHKAFSDPEWMYERKLDGERCLTFCRSGEVRLRSRNKKSLNATYPELVDALARQDCTDYIVDGEVVAFSGGLTSFRRLQPRMQIKDKEKARDSTVAVYYYLFDLLYVNAYDLTGLPLRDRKSLLKKVFSFKDPLRFTPHRTGNGEDYFKKACQKGWEGIIAKKADSHYAHHRSRNWLKFKCGNQQEFVIGGYTDPEGSRVGFGSLLIGYYVGGDLKYAGKVGTGYDQDTLHRLKKTLASHTRKTPPFSGDDLPEKEVHWVTPKLVAQVGFTEWTDDHKLRHPRFLGLRRDKKPTHVRRERSGKKGIS